MVTADTHSLIFGRDDRWAKRWGFGVVALFFGSLVYFAAVKAIGYPTTHLLLWWEGYALLLLLLITVQAYFNEGIVISWMLAFVTVSGLVLNYGGVGIIGSGPGLLELVGLAIVGGAIAAVSLGTLGFGIGMALRRIAT